MNIYLISQTENQGYDTYDSAVVAAETVEDARLTHPSYGEWDGLGGTYSPWCDASSVSVEFIGTTEEAAGVFCSSFNAG